MAVICGVVSDAIGPGRTDALDGVMAVYEPHGDSGAATALRVGRRNAVLGGRRFDVEADNMAAEPNPDASQAVTVIGDLRLDHRDDLAASVGAAPTATDAELVLAAYLRWGDGCIPHLYGDFAFAVADPRRGGVLLARDHAGHRPLVIHERPGLVAFSTTALALTGLDGVGHRLDTERLAQVVALAYSTDRTMVESVRFVGAGHAVWTDDTGTRTWRWWHPNPDDIDDLGSLEAQSEALREVLDAAVASQLRTSGHAGVMLSGGLDSTSVAATAAPMLQPDRLRTYTSVPPSGFEGGAGDTLDASERHLVEELARRYPNIDPAFIDVSGRDPFEHHEALWELGAGPTRNAMNVMWIFAILEEAAADGVTAILTGAAGNVAFSADGQRWLVELARRGRLIRMTSEMRAWASARNQPLTTVARRNLLTLVAPGWLRRHRDQRRGRASRLDDWVGATALRDDRVDGLDLASLIPTMDSADPTRWTRLPTVASAGAAQAETHTAFRAWWRVDMRDPTSERRLLEHAVRQPDWWRRHQGVDRAIVRSAMADRLPPGIVDRTRRGAQLPDWFDRLDDARQEVEEQLEELRDHPTSREVMDVDRLDQLVKNWPTDRSEMATREAAFGYRLMLPRALMVSRYVRWFEERGRRVAADGPAVVVPER